MCITFGADIIVIPIMTISFHIGTPIAKNKPIQAKVAKTGIYQYFQKLLKLVSYMAIRKNICSKTIMIAI